MNSTQAAFAKFTQHILAGETGIFFSDYAPDHGTEFHMGVGVYDLVPFAADKFPVFSVFDWKGDTNFNYHFDQHWHNKDEIPEATAEARHWLENQGVGDLFDFSKQTTQANAWQEKIKKIITHQQNGEAWVLNLAHNYVAGDFADIDSFKAALLLVFYRFLKLDKSHCAGIVITNEQMFCSLSPELFIRQKNGQILTSPIKGTGTVEYLENSDKEKSELDMVTDLLRNDLGKICDKVTVLQERFLVAEKNFYSARSLIRGDFSKNLTQSDYQSLLPAGSISGAPKARVTDIIEHLEGFKRSFYTGTMGVRLSPTESVYNILIRTIFGELETGRWSFPVGVGLTAESDPIAEWEETWKKAQLLTDLAS